MCVAAGYRRLTLTMLVSAFGRAASLSAVILIIIASAILFGQILAFTGVIQQATSNIADLDINRWLVFALLLLIPFVLCMFLDQIGLMMILIPIYDPIIAVLGFPDVWFWLIFLIFMSVGGITPPLGYILFAVAAAYPAIRVRQLFGAALLPVCITLTVVLLLSIFPILVTLLPSMLRH
jgi:TRAP-type C4-dicarboxylate transport system permease large subunit